MGGSRTSGSRVAGGEWHAAPVPCPWLTRAALTVAALYGVLADGPRTWAAPAGPSPGPLACGNWPGGLGRNRAGGHFFTGGARRVCVAGRGPG